MSLFYWITFLNKLSSWETRWTFYLTHWADDRAEYLYAARAVWQLSNQAWSLMLTVYWFSSKTLKKPKLLRGFIKGVAVISDELNPGWMFLQSTSNLFLLLKIEVLSCTTEACWRFNKPKQKYYSRIQEQERWGCQFWESRNRIGNEHSE